MNDAQRIAGQDLVVRAYAVTFEVERHVVETVPFSRCNELSSHGRFERSRQLCESELETCDLSVPAHPSLLKAKRVQVFFEGRDLCEPFTGDGSSIRDATR